MDLVHSIPVCVMGPTLHMVHQSAEGILKIRVSCDCCKQLIYQTLKQQQQRSSRHAWLHGFQCCWTSCCVYINVIVQGYIGTSISCEGEFDVIYGLGTSRLAPCCPLALPSGTTASQEACDLSRAELRVKVHLRRERLGHAIQQTWTLLSIGIAFWHKSINISI